MNCTNIIQKVKNSIALVVILDSKRDPLATGSGFVFQKANILVTCNHVVSGASSILLKFLDLDEYIPAKIVIKDEEHDIALLKFEDRNRKPLTSGNFEAVVEGVEVVFSGYPLSSSDLTTHQGIISTITKDATNITSYLIDGTVNAGNSGCPLMDIDGNVIGVVDAKRRVRGEILEKIERMQTGAVSLHNVDLVDIYQAISSNLQLGVGHAVPAGYVPEYKEVDRIKIDITLKKNNNV